MELTTSEQIAFYCLYTIKAGLKLETLGMQRSRGPSCWRIAKGLVGGKTKKETLALLEKHIAELHGE